MDNDSFKTVPLFKCNENELTKEVGYEVFINDFILPREIAKFFFFDAEKIVSLAEAKSKSELKNLSKAYSEVLGIKKYEDLKKNLEILLSKLKRSGASKLEQSNPVNKAKYETANKALQSAGNLLNAVDGALSSGGSTVQYSLDKKQTEMWNFIVGTQYQYNKHIMLRGEVGFLGTRTQVLAGLQYRFGL